MNARPFQCASDGRDVDADLDGIRVVDNPVPAKATMTGKPFVE